MNVKKREVKNKRIPKLTTKQQKEFVEHLKALEGIKKKRDVMEFNETHKKLMKRLNDMVGEGNHQHAHPTNQPTPKENTPLYENPAGSIREQTPLPKTDIVNLPESRPIFINFYGNSGEGFGPLVSEASGGWGGRGGRGFSPYSQCGGALAVGEQKVLGQKYSIFAIISYLPTIENKMDFLRKYGKIDWVIDERLFDDYKKYKNW